MKKLLLLVLVVGLFSCNQFSHNKKMINNLKGTEWIKIKPNDDVGVYLKFITDSIFYFRSIRSDDSISARFYNYDVVYPYLKALKSHTNSILMDAVIDNDTIYFYKSNVFEENNGEFVGKFIKINTKYQSK